MQKKNKSNERRVYLRKIAITKASVLITQITLLVLFMSFVVSCAKTRSPILLVANSPAHINDNVIIAFFI